MESIPTPAGEVTEQTSSPDDPVHPGVYVQEFDALPPSMVGVQTAVPAFIGYTEQAEVAGKSVLNQPVMIGSLEEYVQAFGAGPATRYRIQVLETEQPGCFSVVNPTGASPQTVWFTLAADSPRYNLYNSLCLFYANGGGPCYVVSVGTYADPIVGGDLVRGLDAIAEQVGPTLLVVPDAVLLPPDDPATPWVSTEFAQVAQAMLAQAGQLQDRFALLDVYGTPSVPATPPPGPILDTVIAQFRADVGWQGLDFGAAYFPFLATTIVSTDDVDYAMIGNAPAAPGAPGILQQILGWEALNLFPDTNGVPDPRRAAVQAQIDLIPDTPAEGVIALDASLTAAIPLLRQMELWIAADLGVLPPSPAMAGVMATVDVTRGVWNAPANVPLAAVTQPTVQVTDTMQQELNAPVDGKAVDAIRAFPTTGPVPWGARTLDGNSTDYRYIPVRRTAIYIDQSIQAALSQFAVWPNTGTTWSTAVAMVSAFLQGVWSQGGLLGSTPADAFSVACGPGSTMTALDAEEGRMIVQVNVALVHPAEYIALTFTQQVEAAG